MQSEQTISKSEKHFIGHFATAIEIYVTEMKIKIEIFFIELHMKVIVTLRYKE